MVIFSSCTGEKQAEENGDKIPMVMIDGKQYYDTGKEAPSAEEDLPIAGEITSSVEGTEIPTENNQSNFGTGFAYRYGADDTIEILCNEKWMVFAYREGTGSQVKFGDKMIDVDGLSQETLDWLAWYNSLPAEEQLAVSAIPADLYAQSDYVGTEDAEAIGD